MKRTVLMGLGSNRGDKKSLLQRAVAEIERRGLGRVTAKSSLWRTEPKGMAGEKEEFLNAVIRLETDLKPEELLSGLLAIEEALGRRRGSGVRPEGRTLDLDILFWGDEIIERPGLHIPHPRLHERRFALAPLCELAPDFLHPVLKQTLRALQERVSDPAWVERLPESW